MTKERRLNEYDSMIGPYHDSGRQGAVVRADAHGSILLLALLDKGKEKLFYFHHILVIFLLYIGMWYVTKGLW